MTRAVCLDTDFCPQLYPAACTNVMQVTWLLCEEGRSSACSQDYHCHSQDASLFSPAKKHSWIARLWVRNVNMLARLRYATTRAWTVSVNLQGYSSAPALRDVADSWRNPAAVLHGIDDLRFENLPMPHEVPGHLVRVQMRSVGICGSDVHMLKQVPLSDHLLQQVDDVYLTASHAVQGRIGHYVLKSPTVLGHECAGYMTTCGPLLLFRLSWRQHLLCACNVYAAVPYSSINACRLHDHRQSSSAWH